MSTVWAATLPHLTPADFDGLWMLRVDGKDHGVFRAKDRREAARSHQGTRRRNPQKVVTYVPLAEVVFAA